MNGAELVEVDARGLYCPIPILRLASALERCPPGGRALLLATDRDAIPDVDSYCLETGATLISLREENEVLIFEVAKAEALG